MSNYFRSAARCDRTVAADAPVPLYNADLPPPPPENSSIDENNTSTGIDDYRSFDERSVAKYTTGGGGGGGSPSASSSLARSRALLDHQRHTDDRLLQKREANVMTKLAMRVEAMNRRIEQEAELNARLLATVKKTFPDRPAVVEDEGTGETTQPSAVEEEGDRANRSSAATQQPPSLEMGQQQQQQPSSLHNLSLKDTIAALQEASSTIPLFQLIQTEEERNARRVLVPTTSSAPANITIQEKRKLAKQQQARPRCEGEIVVGGSIQAMYNDLTLQELRETFPDVPPSVLVERFADRIIVPTTTTTASASNNNNRQKSSIFPNRSGSSSSTPNDAAVAVLPSTLPVVAEVIHRTSSHAQRLRDALERVRQSEQEAAAAQLLQQSERDRQRSTLLMELVTQDRLRHKAAEEKRLYQLVKYHEQTLIGSFVSTVQRVTPAVAAAAAPSSLAILDHSGRGASSSLSLPVDADVERVLADPSLPKVPENVKRALQQSRKPPHPIDLYQAKVRAEMGIPLE